MNFVRQAIVCRTNPTQTKLSELVATGFNSSKAFGGGNWRKTKMADTDKIVEQLSNLSVLEIAGLSSSLRKNGASAPLRQ